MMLHIALFFCILSSIYAQSEVVPYRFPMLLGRGYNLDSHKVGLDLFSVAEMKKAEKRRNTLTDAYFKMIKTNDEANKLLDVKGEISLKVKAGNFNFQGSGSYLKNAQNREEVVEVLVRHKFRTIKRTIHASSPPMAGCGKLSPTDRGTHFIRSIQYGGMMVASLRFIATNQKEKQDIEAAIDGSVGAEGKFGLEVKGKFKKLQESTSGKYRLEYSIYATSLLDSTPGTVEEFLKAIEEFPVKAKQHGEQDPEFGAIGVPIEVEVYTIDGLDGCKPSPPVNWRRNTGLNADIEDLEAKFDDIRVTRNAFNAWSRQVDVTNIKEEALRQFGVFNKKLRDIDRALRKTISDLDISSKAGPDQFYDAQDAYAPDGNDYNNILYRREHSKIKKDIRENGCISRKCPSGTQAHGGNCYMFKTDLHTYYDSRQQCRTRLGDAADLTSIASDTEANWVNARAVERKVRFWIGGRRSESNRNNWVWTNGDAWRVTRWYPGEPNNAGGRESCLEIYGHLGSTGNIWNDHICTEKKGYICKMKPACSL